eukprot:4223651-Prymnesium_polylepis.1
MSGHCARAKQRQGRRRERVAGEAVDLSRRQRHEWAVGGVAQTLILNQRSECLRCEPKACKTPDVTRQSEQLQSV